MAKIKLYFIDGSTYILDYDDKIDRLEKTLDDAYESTFKMSSHLNSINCQDGCVINWQHVMYAKRIE
jgi:hypothetical protein